MILPSKRIYQPRLANLFSDLVIGQSTRQAGVSPSPFTSLNLGLHTQDDPNNVSENRKLFCADLGIRPEQMAGGYQVHGAEVKAVTEGGQWEGFDAFISDQPNLFLTITIADCVPVLLIDPVQKAIGAAHAGWKGTVGQIAFKTFQAMQTQFMSNVENCYAYIGTCIDECSFEVDADVADHFTSPYKRWDAERSKFFVDLKKANQEQLLAAGFKASNIEISPHSTVLDNEWYFSHRKEKGQTGRGLAIVGWKV